ncbi:cation diffusion facilitator family transporter [Noviherbaspirillum sp. CPCC 100848]|uniref:Cation diffusion facilitator family transporter n=1 Tax=Noviherbaspirillum album TaxID=3080276 RepID=A0ABU6J4A5_9BURK|nr:cation diffusion facilitator family transporter [Noviherbaspirillum sp. CPCC 100848]MEC4718445.1 cation diffusion facilitator family transporter [Noviherbaspirillum sp. CPCC 100848]
MGSGHSHGVSAGQNERPLWIALALTTAFLIAEVIGGLLVNSLALISDAAHMFTDAAALAISLVAIRIGKKPADSQRTFGYYRFEILAAAFNAILLFLVAVYILFEAYQRLKSPPEIQSGAMLAIASLGLVINLISMRLLSAGKEDSLNIKGAYLEVWSDMLGSIGVIIGAIVIRWTNWGWVDSAIAVVIGLWVLPRTWILLKESMNVLLEGVPEGVGLIEVETAILAHPGIVSIHDLHVWSISSGKASLTVHVVSADKESDWPALLTAIRTMLADKFDIHHTTVQIEKTPCEQESGLHVYIPMTSAHDG